MNCENCGRVISDNAVICPNCGTTTPASLPRPDQPRYTPPQQGYMPQQPGYPLQQSQPGYMPQQSGYPPQQPQPGYMPQQPGYPPPQQGYMPPPQNYGYPPQQYPPMYQSQGVNVTVVNNANTKSNTPVLVEVLLSMFLGIYGVGWLMAGESTTGIVLLICSFVIYWPLLIAIAVFTLGVGLACDFPLAIAAIIVNAVLLNGALKRRATQITMMQTR